MVGSRGGREKRKGNLQRGRDRRQARRNERERERKRGYEVVYSRKVLPNFGSGWVIRTIG